MFFLYGIKRCFDMIFFAFKKVLLEFQRSVFFWRIAGQRLEGSVKIAVAAKSTFKSNVQDIEAFFSEKLFGVFNAQRV